MKSTRVASWLFLLTVNGLVHMGCTARNVDFTRIQRPERSAKLDAYDIFVGSWTWEAQMLNAADADKAWKGTAEWKWTLDQRCLQGHLVSEGAHARFESSGIWTWHPRAKRYIWWMFNNWGYPQQGTATYNADRRCWCMDYKSVGLDGTASYGRHTLTVMDHDTLAWSMNEWADAVHLVKKMELEGTYKRRK